MIERMHSQDEKGTGRENKKGMRVPPLSLEITTILLVFLGLVSLISLLYAPSKLSVQGILNIVTIAAFPIAYGIWMRKKWAFYASLILFEFLILVYPFITAFSPPRFFEENWICFNILYVINRKVLDRDKVNEITDRVEEQLLRQKETVFKEFWHCQLILEKKQRQKCIKCPFSCFCFPDFGVCFDEGYKFNKRAIEGFCMDKELKGTIKRLNKIIETEGHQSHDWSNPLKNKWYEEMKREAEMEEYRKQHRKPIYDRWWRLKFRLFGKQPKTCPYCGGKLKLKENGLEGHTWRLWCSNCERTLISK